MYSPAPPAHLPCSQWHVFQPHHHVDFSAISALSYFVLLTGKTESQNDQVTEAVQWKASAVSTKGWACTKKKYFWHQQSVVPGQPLSSDPIQALNEATSLVVTSHNCFFHFLPLTCPSPWTYKGPDWEIDPAKTEFLRPLIAFTR